uniref:Uncharacterized protein n=1 Tax=Triticum urartu TaxID=4572 RepID=A0A8R7K322_TRIUA
GSKRSKREEEAEVGVEEEGWRGCCGSTGPGSTSSGDASSCCSATMTDARSADRCLPATLPLLHHLCLLLCPATMYLG